MKNYSRLEDVLAAYTSFDEGDTPSVEYKTIMGEPVIFAAAHNGDLEALELLLAVGANIDSRGEYGNTPLHEAIEACNFEAARYLLSKGAKPNIRNGEGKLPKDCCWEGEWPGIFGEQNA
jgi:ankyrin repeat protein